MNNITLCLTTPDGIKKYVITNAQLTFTYDCGIPKTHFDFVGEEHDLEWSEEE